MELISIKNLNYSVNGKSILNDMNMSINKGDIISIIGPNNSGKTTLLKIISGIISNKNFVTYNEGFDYKDISYVIGDYNPFLTDDVYTSLAFTLENLNLDNDSIQKQILNICDYLDISYLLDKKCNDLKEEEKQIVNIASSIIHNPKILILDNPFDNIKKSKRKILINKIKELAKDKEMTIIISSNDLEDILFTDYTYLLNEGKLILEGNTIDVLKEDIIFKNIGLELPFSINLSLMLKFYEIYKDIDKDYNEVIDKLWN